MNYKKIIKITLLLSILSLFMIACNGNNVTDLTNISTELNTISNEPSFSTVKLGDLGSTGMTTNLANANDNDFNNVVYASPKGKSGNKGTSTSPYDLMTALDKVESNKATTILLQSGTYSFDRQINIEISGTSKAYNVLKASKGSTVILDFSNESYQASSNDRGIQLNANYWYIGNITIKGAADNGMMVSGNYNVVERCTFDGNRDTGLQISRKNSSLSNIKDWPSYNYIINCTSKNNCDPATYENADGFASKLTCGPGNVFDGCISHNNSDDGWDLYAKSATGPIGVVTIRNCISMRNGITEDGTTKSSCDGNGFKLGGGGVGTAHQVQNCLAIENLYNGFTDNNNPSSLSIKNATAFDNNQGNKKNNFSVYRCKDGIVSNLVSYTTNNTSDKFKNVTADHIVYMNSKKWYKINSSQSLNVSTSSTRGDVLSNGISASDFQSTNVPSVGTDFDKKWRNSDGTINTGGVGIISSSSNFSTFASDGEIIGARFSSNNNPTMLSLSINGTVIPNNPDDSDPSDPSDDTDNPATPEIIEDHNFSTVGTNSTFYSIKGNLSSSKGTVTYNNLTLTKCLKMESSTNISFSLASKGTITLVFNSNFNKTIKIDGTKHQVLNGILKLELSAGNHTITKGDSSNLYYISLEKEGKKLNSFSALNNSTATVSIIESKGWLETASIKWKAVNGATGYNVYYQSSSNSEFTKLNNNLIRKYSNYYRADILGVKEGTYKIKIIPLVNGKESTVKSGIKDGIEVKQHIREGFAFSNKSPMKTGSGGYNDNGTIPSNAQILYVTSDNVNTITLDVISNSKGTKKTYKGLTNILSARKKGYDKNPLIIRLIGTIKDSDIEGLNSNGYLQLKGIYNTTFEGIGDDATVYGWGILIRAAHNVEVRNLGVMLFPDDGISLDTDNENIWVHNNDIFYGTAGSDKDQAKGDGSCDVKKSDYITISYNHFYDSGKCSLCGMKDTAEFRVTYHHNWFDHSDSRHPRIRVGTIHIYNNYFDGNSKYGVGVTKGSSAFVEANYFRHCKHPMMSSLQGTDILNNSKGGFSGEAGGMIKAYNNKIEQETSLIYAQQDSTQFDAYLSTSRNETVSSKYKTVSGGTTYNNFDTASSMYNYNPLSPNEVKENVTSYAGRVEGGDFVWKFSTDEDTSYTINTDLMSKLKNYKTNLISVGGN